LHDILVARYANRREMDLSVENPLISRLRIATACVLAPACETLIVRMKMKVGEEYSEYFPMEYLPSNMRTLVIKNLGDYSSVDVILRDVQHDNRPFQAFREALGKWWRNGPPQGRTQLHILGTCHVVGYNMETFYPEMPEGEDDDEYDNEENYRTNVLMNNGAEVNVLTRLEFLNASETSNPVFRNFTDIPDGPPELFPWGIDDIRKQVEKPKHGTFVARYRQHGWGD